MNELYVDGIGQIHFVSNMIRMDLVTVNPGGDNKVDSEVKQRIILNPNGFIGMLETMQKMADKLVEGGVFSKDESETTESADKAETPKRKKKTTKQ